ncbi:MAG: hypothetical protein ABFD10_02510 [Prolixibacteraceae bacterium]
MNVQDTGYNQGHDRKPAIKPEFNPGFMEQQYPVGLLFNARNQNKWDEQHASNPKCGANYMYKNRNQIICCHTIY